MSEAYYRLGGCRDLLQGCYALGNTSVSDGVCYAADVYCVSTPSPLSPCQNNPGQFIWLFRFSGKVSKETQPRDIMNMISDRRIHLYPVPGIFSSNISIQSRCGKPLAQKFPSLFHRTLLKLCLTRLVMWFLLIIFTFNQFWISSRTLDRAWNNFKASWTRSYWPLFG